MSATRGGRLRTGREPFALVLLALAAAGLSRWLGGASGPRWDPCYPVVVLAALRGGWRVGLLATLAAGVAGWPWPAAAPSATVVVFLATGAVLTGLAEWARRRAAGVSMAAQHRLEDIIEFLPDATFVVDDARRVIAWNRACEVLTGVPKAELLGRGDQAYAEPFWGERRATLVDLLDQPEAELAAYRGAFRRSDGTLCAEEFHPHLQRGAGAHVWSAAAPLYDRAGRRSGAIEVKRDVTDERRVAQALRHSEEQFRQIMANLADLVAVLDRDGRRLYNSPSYQGLLGDPQQLRGSSSFDQIHPADRGTVEAAFRDTVATGVGHRLEYRLLDRQGEARHIESQGSAIRDPQGQVAQVVVVARDVTERRQAAARLEASERKYRELVENANSIILHWTRDGLVLFLNEFGQRFFGYTQEEICGRHVVGTIVPETESSGRNLRPLMEQIRANPPAFEQNVNENVRRNGERVWVAWTNKVVLDTDGQVAEVLSIGADITARKLAEEELRATQASLEQRVIERTSELAVARDRAEAADRTKSAFLASMSHELRTPLNSIIGFTGLLLQGLAGPLNEEQAKQLGMVKNSGQHLLALINDVLDISKIEAGQIEIARQRFDLRQSVETVVHAVSPLADKKQLALRTSVSPAVDALVSDRRRVEQILLNLLSNAIKFTERGAVTLTVEAVPEDADGRAAAVRLAVADTGLGIAAEDLPKLFQPFRQLDTGLTRQHEGTGLGLAICRRLAERLGGSITVESEFGRGSTFRVTLPLAVEDDG